ncbi:MAG: sigma-54-dependent Fis family transcriptional regulator [Myxococcales bacterium]|nr:sigma-54-dependent Fis family transcriptional regulator [Myxococcales bacterium]TDI97947.1 MAG: sigma-54-dependent Fis family transcriptional regulator [Deltaproteobacteria bacterium]TDJ05354.1 MAG: sigma-54-dependent Fis family transcriptional regulator [Deltaproteobacteria bacterium]
MASSILIVDDEESICRAVAGILADEGYTPASAASVDEALQRIEQQVPDLVLLDVAMPARDGIELLEELRRSCPELPVIMMSGHGTIETAVRATKLGAYDFLEKPLSYDKLLLCLARALETSRLAQENRRLREEITRTHEIIGESPVMQELLKQIAVAAPTDGRVLITGENGTGKELVARQIHLNSKRVSNPFVEVNCAAIPEELIESVLFGHEKGAFTGAIQMKRGRFEMADAGTIFLDEIGDMSLMTQAKILRILQEHRFERVGGSETLEVNVRVIAATNKNLETEMAEGRFREDLYYRLNVIPIYVPPLRQRRDDIRPLLEHFLERASAQNSGSRRSLSAKALEKLAVYPWPGNVRELQNIVERLVLMCPRPVIDVEDLPPQIAHPDREKLLRGLQSEKLADARAAFEREYLLGKLRANQWNISRTAEVVGLARESLSRKLRSLGITVEKQKDVE